MKRALFLFVTALAIAWCMSGNVEAAGLKAGDIVIGDGVSTGARVSVLNPQTKAITVVCLCTVMYSLRSLAVKGTEKIYMLGQIGSTVARQGVVAIDPVTGVETVVSSGGSLTDAWGIAVEADGSILVTQNTVLYRINPSNGTQTIVSTGGRMIGAGGLTVGPNGQIYVATQITGFPRGSLPNSSTIASGVVRIDPVTGQQTVIAYGDDWDLGIDSKEMISAADLVIDDAGSIYVLDKRFRGSTSEDETRVIKVNPTTGAQTLLNNSLKGVDHTKTGFAFGGIAVLNGFVYVPDYRLSETGLPGISQVSTSGGTRTGVTTGSLNNPTGVAVAGRTIPPRSSAADCFFDWAEQHYSQLFPPPGTPSATYGTYYYRYYPAKSNYLATSTTDNHVWVLGPSFGNALLDAGSLTGFLAAAGCSP
jgi:hypothetical protein